MDRPVTSLPTTTTGASLISASVTSLPSPTTIYDNGQAITTLLATYSSADLTLYSANLDQISLASSFAEAQSSYNAALSRGETPIPPSLPVVINGTTSTVPVVGTQVSRTGLSTKSGASTTRGSSSSQGAATSAQPTGAAGKTSVKFAVVALLGLAAGMVISA